MIDSIRNAVRGPEDNTAEYIEKVFRDFNSSEKSYVEDRVLRRIGQYQHRARWWGRLYKLMGVLAIALSAAVPVLLMTKISDAVPAGLSVAVTVMVSLESLFQTREMWRAYDLAEEELRTLLYRYITTRASLDQGAEQWQSAYHRFVQKVEKTIMDERRSTIQRRTSDSGILSEQGGLEQAFRRVLGEEKAEQSQTQPEDGSDEEDGSNTSDDQPE